jgi:hypothetical protein
VRPKAITMFKPTPAPNTAWGLFPLGCCDHTYTQCEKMESYCDHRISSLQVLSWSKDVMTAPKEFRLHTLYTLRAIHERDSLFNLC